MTAHGLREGGEANILAWVGILIMLLVVVAAIRVITDK
jgi:hypothetical protein